MAFFDPFKQLPGYREAVEAETYGRDVAWLNLTERINGVEVLPFTPEHFLILSVIKSPFLCGGFPTQDEVARFLWVVSPGFIPGNSAIVSWKRYRFVAKHCRTLKWQDTLKAIHEYVEAAVPSDEPSKSRNVSYFSCMAGLVDAIASEYGWAEQTILRTPFKKLWQLFNARALRHDPQAKLCNPSQKMISDHLREANAKLREQRN